MLSRKKLRIKYFVTSSLRSRYLRSIQAFVAWNTKKLEDSDLDA